MLLLMNEGIFIIAMVLIILTVSQWRSRKQKKSVIDDASEFYDGCSFLAVIIYTLAPVTGEIYFIVLQVVLLVSVFVLLLREQKGEVASDQVNREVGLRVVWGCIIVVLAAILSILNDLMNSHEPLLFETSFSSSVRPFMYILLAIATGIVAVQMMRQASIRLFKERIALHRLAVVSVVFYITVFSALTVRALFML
ncbi:MAG: hypothetical protein PUJ57_03630 [Peptoniphilaceae bacterium]|nr:hypothetical protein [Peptoniphilaceae bacterium]MDY6085145.1 hypothetical protein [Peptoniphilaceae bacterium]